MHKQIMVTALASIALTGCDLPASPAPPDPDLVEAQKRALRQPPNRFQNAGKREYSNGTEIYVLDTQTGQVCYYFAASGTGDDKSQKSDMQACAGPALAPELP